MSRLFPLENVVDTDDWYTPAWIFDGLGLRFHLDVASPDEPLTWIPTDARFTVADDGLTQAWHGLVWCNPPYSEPLPWCRRWAEHANGLILLRSDLSTSGPFTAATAATTMYLPPKRLQFVSAVGHPSGAANFSTILFGAGRLADSGIARLAQMYGGAARRLAPVHAQEVQP